MLEKSALPTPTMTMERGRPDAATIASIEFYMSIIAPSVSIRRIVYCWLYWDVSMAFCWQ